MTSIGGYSGEHVDSFPDRAGGEHAVLKHLTQEEFDTIFDLMSKIQDIRSDADTSSLNMWLTSVAPLPDSSLQETNKMSQITDKADRAVEWFMSLKDEDRQRKALKEIFDYCIESEMVSVWSENDARELSEEAEVPIEKYRAPYWSATGESIA